MQKPLNEHLTVVPPSPQTNLISTTNYFAVVSEGNSVTNIARIGYGSSSFIIESRGELGVIDLGAVGSTDLVHTATLEGGTRCRST